MTTLPDIAGFGLIVWAIVVLLLLILLTVIFLVVYSGVLEHVKVGAGKSKFGKLTFAYKYARGAYSDCGDEAEQLMAKLPAGLRSMSIYYDDPKKTPDKDTRYITGAVLGEGEETVTEETKKEMESKGYGVFTIPEAEHCVFASFRYTTRLSVYLASRRIYPAFARYIKENRLCAHPTIEIYTHDRIEFFSPLSKQDDYYVPEVAGSEPGTNVRDDSFDSGSHSDSSNATGSDTRDESVDESNVETTETSEAVTTETSKAVTTETTEVVTTETKEPITEERTEPTEFFATETTEVVSKEPTGTTEPVTKETSEPVTTETTESITAETTESVITETTEPVTTETTESVVKETTEPVTTETTESVTMETTESDKHITDDVSSDTTESAASLADSESKSEGHVTPDPALTPSDAGSEQSGSSFEDLAAEARQMGKVEPSESDIQEIQEDERAID